MRWSSDLPFGNAEKRRAFRDKRTAGAAAPEQYAAPQVQYAPLSPRPSSGNLLLETFMLASRNLLVALVLVLVVGLVVTGYALYQEKKQPEGVEISVGKNGLSIKEK